MSWTLQDDIAEVELLQLNVGTCEGPCQRPEVPRVICGTRRVDCDKEWTMCGNCAEEYEEYWDEMWESYRNAIL